MQDIESKHKNASLVQYSKPSDSRRCQEFEELMIESSLDVLRFEFRLPLDPVCSEPWVDKRKSLGHMALDHSA
jgi:hypothetical protein